MTTQTSTETRLSDMTTTAPATPAAKRRGPVYWVGVALSGLVLLAVLGVAVAVIAVPALTRSTPYTILTGSMTPTYPPGTLVIVKPIDPQQIKIGDVVTYQLQSGQPEVVTHRVIAIQAPTTAGGTERFITKGDANDVQDEKPVRPVQIRGVVWYAVPYIGWVNNVVNGDMRPVIIPIVAGGLFLYAGWMMVSHLVGRRRSSAALARSAGVTAAASVDPVEEELAALGSAEQVPADSAEPAAERELEPTAPRRSRFMPPAD